MSDVWTQWEGQVINGKFPLRRCLGMSDHSGVFLTEDTARDIPNAALKLVPLIPTLAESQLAHWAAAAALKHPNLLRLLETGRCQLGSQHYLYVVMEYAEQNLAHLLQHRPLSEAEVREMLPLTLDALTFLHDRGLVQGQLKPSNVLVVGNQLKLASDTIRPAGEATASIGTLSLYNPPEARDGSGSTSADIWALGVTLCQGLTTRLPSRSGDRSDDLVLPPDLPVSFVSVIRRCLIRNPAIRPTVSYLRDWLARETAQQNSSASDSVEGGSASSRDSAEPSAAARDSAEPSAAARDAGVRGPGGRDSSEGRSHPRDSAVSDSTGRDSLERSADERRSDARDSTGPAAAVATSQPTPPPNTTKPDVNSAVLRAEPLSESPPPRQRSYVPVAVAAVVLVAIGWGVVHFLGGRSEPAVSPDATETADATAAAPDVVATPPANSVPPAASSPVPPSAAGPSHTATAGHRSSSPRGSARSAPTGGGDGADSGSVIHEELPSVPLHARQTIHGRVKVAVLVTVDSSGVVVNDTLNHAGPSKYFAQLASEAAKKWRFAPTSASHRWLVHFEFSREGVKAHATPSN